MQTVIIIIILTGQIYLFLALCFFVVHRTGSTEGWRSLPGSVRVGGQS